MYLCCDFHVEVLVDGKADEEGVVLELVGPLHLLPLHTPGVLDVLVAVTSSEVLHEPHIIPTDSPLEGEVSLLVRPRGRELARGLLEGLHPGREVCPAEAQWSVIPSAELCSRRENVAGRSTQTGQRDNS